MSNNFVVGEHEKNTNLVLIIGDIETETLISKLYEVSLSGNNVHIIQSVKNSKCHPFKSHIELICKEKNIKNEVFYLAPCKNDKKGLDYDYEGFISYEYLMSNVNLNSKFYMYGLPSFIRAIEIYLLDLGVKGDHIHY